MLLRGLGHVRSVQLELSTQLELALNELPMLLLPRRRRSVGRSLPQAGLTQRSGGRPRPPPSPALPPCSAAHTSSAPTASRNGNAGNARAEKPNATKRRRPTHLAGGGAARGKRKRWKRARGDVDVDVAPKGRGARPAFPPAPAHFRARTPAAPACGFWCAAPKLKRRWGGTPTPATHAGGGESGLRWSRLSSGSRAREEKS